MYLYMHIHIYIYMYVYVDMYSCFHTYPDFKFSIATDTGCALRMCSAKRELRCVPVK